jgi:hypothetical protein
MEGRSWWCSSHHGRQEREKEKRERTEKERRKGEGSTALGVFLLFLQFSIWVLSTHSMMLTIVQIFSL